MGRTGRGMVEQRRRTTIGRTLLCVAVANLLGACTHAGFGSIDRHFATFKVTAPAASRAGGTAVTVCHAYGCSMRTRFTFTPADLAIIKQLMESTRQADTPFEERRAVAYAIGWIERRVGDAIGTKDDRAGMDFAGSGDPTQQDCVDESTNTTSNLLVLQMAGFLRHHTVMEPFAKENYLRGIAGWTHWTAVLKETAGGQRWAIDSWIYANGVNPAVVEVEKWYIADLASLPKPTQ
jgi:hypothetical protein